MLRSDFLFQKFSIIYHNWFINNISVMSNRLVYVSFKFRTLFILRQQTPCISSTSTFSTQPRTIDPSQQMKMHNDKKQFKQTIELFERETNKNKKQLSSFVIVQALKACTDVRDFRRGQDIHQLVQHRLSADSLLVRSLIHFYSMLIANQTTLF